MKSAIVLSLLSGILLGISFNYPSVWFMSLFALIPFIHFLYTTTFSLKKIFFAGWLFGFTFLGIVLVWLWHTLPLDLPGTEDSLFGVALVLFSWGSSVFTISFFVGLFAVAFYKLKRGTIFDVLLIAFLWIFFEYFRMWGFALLTISSESLFGPHFSVGFLGYILASNHNILQFALLGGVYTLGFIVVLINASVYHLFFVSKLQPQRKLITFFVAFVLFVVFATLPFNNFFTKDDIKSQKTIKIAVLNTYFSSIAEFPKEGKEERFNERKNLIELIGRSNEDSDVIILPENSHFIADLISRGELEVFFHDVFNGKEKLIIDSESVHDNDNNKTYSQLYYYNIKNKKLEIYKKIFLAPQGEYIPNLMRFIPTILGRKDFIEKLDTILKYSKGDNLVSGNFNDIEIGALFCSEILSPSLYKELTNVHSADFLVNLSSQLWFHGSRTLYRQIINVAKVRAVENNRYFVQASNFVPSFIIDNTGRIIAESEWNKNSVLYADIIIP